MNYIKIITASVMMAIGNQVAIAQETPTDTLKEKEIVTEMSEKAIAEETKMEFDNTEKLSGGALQTARTNYAIENATASISKIEAMTSMVAVAKEKIAAAIDRLKAAKETLLEEDFADNTTKIDAAEEKVSNFESSIASGLTKVTAAKEKLTEFVIVE